MASAQYAVFLGCIVDTPVMGQLRVRANGALGVDRSTGRIIGVAEQSGLSSAELISVWVGQTVDSEAVESISLTTDQFLMPGLIDTHTHAPQFAFLGIGHDLPLMDWLNKYTFKHESEFKDADLARRFYKDVIARVVRNGVTFAAYYGTIHLESNRVLAQTIRQIGQRAYVGKVCMDTNSPAYYSESTEDSLRDTEEFIRQVIGDDETQQRLVTPIITPRFVPTCSHECLEGLGALAEKYQLPVQSHLCENPSEIEFAKSCFPDSPSYAHIYHKYGLLNSRTIMAHCVHLSDSEIALMRESKASVSHCPNSNFSLGSGIADIRRFIDEGIPVGLGTDVGGGYTPSILDAMRMAAAANRALIAFRRDSGGDQPTSSSKEKPLEAAEALFLATQGGARVMGMDDQLGSLDTNKLFDAIVVDMNVLNSPVPSVDATPAVRDADSPDEAWRLRLEQFVFLADDRNISRVYVGGKLIHSV
ncbi:hypothetical protein IW146_009560 [Coemansia sp. RSA 922]|nr:hypothetical protein GGI14_000479 [Coemansia sp. S680]KAJ2057021.1 hypothetical protein GGH13_007422 [Coemansia sp. S155-1]KAJ2100430.1 hypothetical protein IW146_009560 [Coemansia sp. RSA 922]